MKTLPSRNEFDPASIAISHHPRQGRDQQKRWQVVDVSGYIISQIPERVRLTSGRLKKTTIVALACKFLVTLWKHLTAGIVLDTGRRELATAK